MILAEIDIHHTRPIAPTRRVALGRRTLPTDPPPGFGGLLLAGIVAHHTQSVDPEVLADLFRLADDLHGGRRVVQPRVRYRFQTDRVGLAPSRHRLVGHGEDIRFELGGQGAPLAQVLGALYAAAEVGGPDSRITELVMAALGWRGPVGPAFITAVTGRRMPTVAGVADPLGWAADVLGVDLRDLDRSRVLRRFRAEIRRAHPDHGGDEAAAGRRIGEITEARRILLDHLATAGVAR